MTASQLASPSAAARAAASLRSACSARAPAAGGPLTPRVSAVTSSPRARASSTTARPTWWVPPSTSSLMVIIVPGRGAAATGAFVLGVGAPGRISRMLPASRSVFDVAASEYDAARPSYPAALFEELERQTGRLSGRLVLDWGAGTGIASRQLAARGAQVISLDIGEQMLRRALARSPAAACVLATGSQMPVRSGVA